MKKKAASSPKPATGWNKPTDPPAPNTNVLAKNADGQVIAAHYDGRVWFTAYQTRLEAIEPAAWKPLPNK